MDVQESLTDFGDFCRSKNEVDVIENILIEGSHGIDNHNHDLEEIDDDHDDDHDDDDDDDDDDDEEDLVSIDSDGPGTHQHNSKSSTPAPEEGGADVIVIDQYDQEEFDNETDPDDDEDYAAAIEKHRANEAQLAAEKVAKSAKDMRSKVSRVQEVIDTTGSNASSSGSDSDEGEDELQFLEDEVIIPKPNNKNNNKNNKKGYERRKATKKNLLQESKNADEIRKAKRREMYRLRVLKATGREVRSKSNADSGPVSKSSKVSATKCIERSSRRKKAGNSGLDEFSSDDDDDNDDDNEDEVVILPPLKSALKAVATVNPLPPKSPQIKKKPSTMSSKIEKYSRRQMDDDIYDGDFTNNHHLDVDDRDSTSEEQNANTCSSLTDASLREAHLDLDPSSHRTIPDSCPETLDRHSSTGGELLSLCIPERGGLNGSNSRTIDSTASSTDNDNDIIMEDAEPMKEHSSIKSVEEDSSIKSVEEDSSNKTVSDPGKSLPTDSIPQCQPNLNISASIKIENTSIRREIKNESLQIPSVGSLIANYRCNDPNRNSIDKIESRKAEINQRRRQMAERQQRRAEKHQRHHELQASQKILAQARAEEMERNNLTWKEQYEQMEEERLSFGHVPYVDDRPMPPSEAETMQTASIKDLYSRAKKPKALELALVAPQTMPARPPSPARYGAAAAPARVTTSRHTNDNRSDMSGATAYSHAQVNVPYVDDRLMPPSEAETMQTVSIKDLYKRAKKPTALELAPALPAPPQTMSARPPSPARYGAAAAPACVTTSRHTNDNRSDMSGATAYSHAQVNVPYVDDRLMPPSEAETIQTVSIKDLYKRANSRISSMNAYFPANTVVSLTTPLAPTKTNFTSDSPLMPALERPSLSASPSPPAQALVTQPLVGPNNSISHAHAVTNVPSSFIQNNGNFTPYRMSGLVHSLQFPKVAPAVIPEVHRQLPPQPPQFPPQPPQPPPQPPQPPPQLSAPGISITSALAISATVTSQPLVTPTEKFICSGKSENVSESRIFQYDRKYGPDLRTSFTEVGVCSTYSHIVSEKPRQGDLELRVGRQIETEDGTTIKQRRTRARSRSKSRSSSSSRSSTSHCTNPKRTSDYAGYKPRSRSRSRSRGSDSRRDRYKDKGRMRSRSRTRSRSRSGEKDRWRKSNRFDRRDRSRSESRNGSRHRRQRYDKSDDLKTSKTKKFRVMRLQPAPLAEENKVGQRTLKNIESNDLPTGGVVDTLSRREDTISPTSQQIALVKDRLASEFCATAANIKAHILSDFSPRQPSSVPPINDLQLRDEDSLVSEISESISILSKELVSSHKCVTHSAPLAENFQECGESDPYYD